MHHQGSARGDWSGPGEFPASELRLHPPELDLGLLGLRHSRHSGNVRSVGRSWKPDQAAPNG